MFDRCQIVLIVLTSLALRSQVIAASVWDGGGSDNNWSTAQNWTSNVAPTNDGTADVVMDGTTRLTPNIDVPWNVNSLTFSTNSGSFALGGGPLTVGAGGITNQNQISYGPGPSLGCQIALGADQTWNTGQGNFEVPSSGSVDTRGHALTITGTGMDILGTVGGSGSLVVSVSGLVASYG